jgi:hypothetical protein
MSSLSLLWSQSAKLTADSIRHDAIADFCRVSRLSRLNLGQNGGLLKSGVISVRQPRIYRNCSQTAYIYNSVRSLDFFKITLLLVKPLNFVYTLITSV